MDEIIIRQQKTTDGGMVFLVQIGNRDYAVTLEEEYLQELTKTTDPDKAAELIRKSFRFLLERESKESILPQFSLRQIQDYFPEYEQYIKSKIAGKSARQDNC